jgi:hypothetical protein
MRPQIRKLVVCSLLLVLGAVIIACAVWPRNSRLVVFTSPAATSFNRGARAQVLIPAGWESLGWLGEGDYSTVLYLRPKPRLSWLPRHFQRISGIETEHAVLVIELNSNSHPRPNWNWVQSTVPGGHSEFSVRREIPGGACVYIRANRAEFFGTYRQICDSFKVIH